MYYAFFKNKSIEILNSYIYIYVIQTRFLHLHRPIRSIQATGIRQSVRSARFQPSASHRPLSRSAYASRRRQVPETGGSPRKSLTSWDPWNYQRNKMQTNMEHSTDLLTPISVEKWATTPKPMNQTGLQAFIRPCGNTFPKPCRAQRGQPTNCAGDHFHELNASAEAERHQNTPARENRTPTCPQVPWTEAMA